MPTVHQYFTGTGATETIPTGAVQVVIEVYGGGGGGNLNTTVGGGGGGGAGYSIKTIALSGNDGQTFTYTVGAAGVGKTATVGIGTAGGNSTVTNGTFPTSTSMTANGGAAGSPSANGGTGGTASGGDTNVSGANGDPGTGSVCALVPGYGGNSNGGVPTGFSGGIAIGGLSIGGGGGAGGEGGSPGTSDGGNGGRGSVTFTYTLSSGSFLWGKPSFQSHHILR